MTATIYILDHWRPAPAPALPQVDIADWVTVPRLRHLGVGRVSYVSDVCGVTVLEVTFPGGIVRKLPAREVELWDDDGPGAA